MRVVVCIRQGLDGAINPFDACAYEAALRMTDAEVTLLSMGPAGVKEFLLGLTRLGAGEAVLLCDKAFAGADTLATAYTLSLALKRLAPDLVLCGRQTLVGDTAQTGGMLSVFGGYDLITNVMEIVSADTDKICCRTRSEGLMEASLPALLTVERINTLRLPRLGSKQGTVTVWDAETLGADLTRCGLAGSPTRVLKTFENESGKRNCRFISMEELPAVIDEALGRERQRSAPTEQSDGRLTHVCMVGEAPRSFAEGIAEKLTVIPLDTSQALCDAISHENPSAVLWGSDPGSKRLAAQVAAMLGLGLCADCTALACEGDELMMYRPALSGSIIAKIKSLTRPAMATVRTESEGVGDVIVTAGFGVKDSMDRVLVLAESLGARVCATRKLVDNGYAPYEGQVGLTGQTVSPPVYIAIGVSGAVHHIVGMQRSGTVIAINPDRDAPIFDYADFGILQSF